MQNKWEIRKKSFNFKPPKLNAFYLSILFLLSYTFLCNDLSLRRLFAV